jgi:hypothetical protein
VFLECGEPYEWAAAIPESKHAITDPLRRFRYHLRHRATYDFESCTPLLLSA